VSDSAKAAVAHAFLERLAADRAEGRERTLDEYRALWPGHEDVVEREWAALHAGREAEAEDGDVFGAYRIEGEIGRGAQGVVYRAVDERLGRPVALKVLRRRVGDDEHVLLRFQREARAVARLEHPGLCTVYDSGVERGATYLAMRLVRGESLAARLERGKRLPPRELAALFGKAARALQAAHEAGVVHRDIKPGNVMVTPDGEPVLLDFGLAGGRGTDFLTLTETGDVFGTPAYMAPEQIAGEAVGPAADVYALGVTMYEAATGRRPHDASTLDGLYRSILSGAFRDPREVDPSMPRDLAVIVSTALDRDPGRRYASAGRLAEDLRRFLEREPIRARPARAWLRARRWTERNPVAATALAGLFVVVTTALAITSYLLGESEADRKRLARALEDAELGRASRRRARVDELLRRGFQVGFGVDPRPARALFAEALALDPDNATALAGRVLIELPDRAAAARALAAAPAALRAHPDVAWLRAVVEEAAAPESAAAAPASGSALRAFLEGHIAVANFAPPVDPDAARRAIGHFRRAIMRADRPRFHHYHSLMMAAHRAGDRTTVEEAERALRHHWPDHVATLEAVAQFSLPHDPEKAAAAMRRILELEPSAPAHLGLAHLAAGEGRGDEAGWHLDAAVELAPTLAPARLMRARWREGREDWAGAARDWAEAAAHGSRPLQEHARAALHAALEKAADPALERELAGRLAARRK